MNMNNNITAKRVYQNDINDYFEVLNTGDIDPVIVYFPRSMEATEEDAIAYHYMYCS